MPSRVLKRALVILIALSFAAVATPVLAGSTKDGAALIDINTATVAQLDSLPGIGPAKAKAIVAHRKAKPFEKIEDLMDVKGIGAATFAKIKPLITVTPVGKK